MHLFQLQNIIFIELFTIFWTKDNIEIKVLIATRSWHVIYWCFGHFHPIRKCVKYIPTELWSLPYFFAPFVPILQSHPRPRILQYFTKNQSNGAAVVTHRAGSAAASSNAFIVYNDFICWVEKTHELTCRTPMGFSNKTCLQESVITDVVFASHDSSFIQNLIISLACQNYCN